MGSGYVSIQAGWNYEKHRLPDLDALLAYERDHFIDALDVRRPGEFSDPIFVKMMAPQEGPSLTFDVSEFMVSYGVPHNRVYVRSWYYWLSSEYSIIFRVMSRFSFEELWPEQQSEVNAALASIELTER